MVPNCYSIPTDQVPLFLYKPDNPHYINHMVSPLGIWDIFDNHNVDQKDKE